MSGFSETKQLVPLIKDQSERVTTGYLDSPVPLAEAFDLVQRLGYLPEFSRVLILIHQGCIVPAHYIIIGRGVFC